MTNSFNINDLKLSHNMRYIMYENTIYDFIENKSFNIDNWNILNWLDFLKENSVASYYGGVKSQLSIQKLIRETAIRMSEIFQEKDKYNFLVEFEKLHGNNLILESTKENFINTINDSWNYITNKLDTYLNLVSEQEEKGLWDKIKEKVSSGWKWIKDKGIDAFMEKLREILMSWGGAAAQVIASFTGVGNVVLAVVWGAMLAYDIYKATQEGPNWMNIITDLICFLLAGPGAALMKGIFKAAKIGTGKIPLTSLFQKIGQTSFGKAFMGAINTVLMGLSKISSGMLNGIKWLGEKLGIKFLSNMSTSLKSNLNNFTTQIKGAYDAASKSGVGQAVSSGGKRVFNAVTSKPGMVATVGGLTYAANPDKRMFAGGFSGERYADIKKRENDELLANLTSNVEPDYEGFLSS